MGSYTSRMGLFKPSTGDNVNVVTDLANNWDIVDANMGFARCTSTTRPSVVWPGLCIFETNTNATYVSNGSSPASGSWINIPNASSNITAPAINITSAASSTDSLTIKVTGNAQSRFIANGDGKLEWGSGSGAVDTNLYRSTTNTLKTDGTLATAGVTASSAVNITAAATGTDAFTVKVSGDSQNRFIANGDGKLEWGSGSGAVDTNLYRSAANTLTTDGNLIVGGTLTATGVSGNTTTVVKTSGQTVTSSTTLVNDSMLKVPLVANATYEIVANILAYTTGAGDLKTAWTVPSGATGLKWCLGPTSNSATFTSRTDTRMRSAGHNFTTACTYQLDTSGNAHAIFERVLVFTAGTAGNAQFQFAQNASASPGTTIHTPSYLVVTRVA